MIRGVACYLHPRCRKSEAAPDPERRKERIKEKENQVEKVEKRGKKEKSLR